MLGSSVPVFSYLEKSGTVSSQRRGGERESKVGDEGAVWSRGLWIGRRQVVGRFVFLKGDKRDRPAAPFMQSKEQPSVLRHLHRTARCSPITEGLPGADMPTSLATCA